MAKTKTKSANKVKKDKRYVNDSLTSFKENFIFTEEQREARKTIHDNIVTILTGKPGTSKSFIAATVAMELLMRDEDPTSKDSRYHGEYNKIILSRPTEVVGKELGYTPGDLTEKMMAYVAPVVEIMKELITDGEKKVKEWIDQGRLQITPIQFVRGHTHKNCVVILDEGQNATLEDFKAVSSRIGQDCKLIITSDWRQVDLKDRNKSASKWFDKILELKGVATFELTKNFRHPLAVQIMDVLLEEADLLKELEQQEKFQKQKGEEIEEYIRTKKDPHLDELLEGVTEENLHGDLFKATARILTRAELLSNPDVYISEEHEGEIANRNNTYFIVRDMEQYLGKEVCAPIDEDGEMVFGGYTWESWMYEKY